jgi:signal transduction histidine kinase
LKEHDPDTRAGYADFLARVAHDLRSPLGIVMHVVQQVEMDLASHLTEEHKTLLGLSRRGLRRLEVFVDRMRLVADLEAGKLQSTKRSVNLAEVVKAGVDAARALEPRGEVTVSFEPAASLPEVMVDPRLLSLAVAELVSNAIVYARRNVRVSVTASGAEVLVVVEDDGAGISDAAKKTLFQRFVMHGMRGGLGIGLSLARDVVGINGGLVEATGKSSLPEGRPGTVGARFVVALPAAGGAS